MGVIMHRALRTLWRDERGQALGEYGLILALVAVVAIAALTLLGTGVRDNLRGVADEFN